MLYFSSTIPKMMLQQWSNGKKIQMNCYSAHLSIDVHGSQKQKKYIYFIQLDLIVSIFLFILSNLVIHSLSFSLSLVHLSFLSSSTLSTSSPLSSSLRYDTTCFFFYFSFYQIRSHSLSLIHCHLSSQASQAHSLNVVGPVSLSQL